MTEGHCRNEGNERGGPNSSSYAVVLKRNEAVRPFGRTFPREALPCV